MFVSASIYSIFQPLTDVFESVLKFFHNSGGIGWGLSIILLTIAVRALLIPLTLNSMKSMVRMQAHAPQLKEIQAKYKEDKQRQQQEMQKFYKENNLNPLGACLPTLLQLPVFFALYAMLRESLRNDICPKVQTAFQKSYAANHHVSLHSASSQTTVCGPNGGAHFLFINDLTSKATGITLVVLIVLYVGSQLSSSLLMTATADKSQRQMMMVMPLIFCAFIFRFPSGLLVYWITTNLWTVAQQYIVRRRMGVTRAAMEASGRIPAGSLAAANAPKSDEGLITMLRRKINETSDGGSAASSSRSRGGATAKSSGKPAGGTAALEQPGRTTTKGRTKTPARQRVAKDDTQTTANGNGNGNGSSNGKSSAATSGSGNGSAPKPGSPPPQSPRKRKKRSGRRR